MHRPWGGRALEGETDQWLCETWLPAMLRLGCACSNITMSAVCGWMRSLIHLSIHPSTVEFCFSAIQREIKTDRYTYILRDRNTQNKGRHWHLHRETVRQRHRERQRRRHRHSWGRKYIERQRWREKQINKQSLGTIVPWGAAGWALVCNRGPWF